MKRLVAIACILCFVGGCASDGQWDAFWKDLRGDNMQMQSNFAGSDEKDSHQSQTSGR
jgi:hypothetical protein